MNHSKIIFGIGLALVLITFLGFPPVWNKTLIMILGLWLCGLTVPARYIERFTGKISNHGVGHTMKGESLVENSNQSSVNHEQTPTA